MDRELRGRLDSWVASGLIDQAQAGAIAEFEQRGSDTAGTRTSPAEAIGYVGAALALGALVLLLGTLWSDLLVGGRIAITVALTIAMALSAWALRAAASAAMQRLQSVLMTGVVVGLGWTTAVVSSDLLAMRDENVVVVVGAVAFLTATPLYLFRQRAMLQLASLASLLTLVTASAALAPMPLPSLWQGATVAAVGGAWLLLARGGWHQPRLLADVSGSGVMIVGAQIATFGDNRLAVLVVITLLAAVAAAAAVLLDELHQLILGAIGLFVFVPQLVFEMFGDVIGAPATLLLVGLLLVLLAVGLGRARREVTREPVAADDGQGDPR